MLVPQNKDRQLTDFLKVLIDQGYEGMLEVFQTLLNEAAKIERSEALRAAPYERAKERTGYANGFKDKTVHTRMGAVKLKIPQVRGLEFYPGCIEKGTRSERALKLAVAEMYIQGVSTRKVQKITEELCGFEISSAQVSNFSQLLDEGLEQFRNRPLGRYKYVYLDALYEKIRHQGLVSDWAVLVATGVNEEGKREIIGISTSLSEAEVHWRCFLENLCGRGLVGVELIISDDHSGLKKARKAVFPSVKFQRCFFHLAQNAQHYSPKKSMNGEIADAVREVFNETSLEDAEQRLKRVTERYQETAPKFAEWFEQNAPESFTYFNFPKDHWRKIRTNNNQERLNKEIRRRTRVVSIFPNEPSCIRLITAILQEMHEDWSTGKMYLKL